MFTAKENEEWYRKISEEKGLPDRCPFANPKKCIGYYDSIGVLQKLKTISGFSKEDTLELNKYWKRNKVFIPKEDAPALDYHNGHFLMASKFCPEITKCRWGYYADLICEYSDDLDRNVAHKRLRGENAAPEDYRWTWEKVTPMHFTECPFYSILMTNRSETVTEATNKLPVIETTEPKINQQFRHSPDYSSVTLRGKDYKLTKNAAKAIKVWHEAYINRTPDLRSVFVGEQIGLPPSSELKDSFRRCTPKEAWKELTVPGPKRGTRRLNIID